jgi:hypothetical protein
MNERPQASGSWHAAQTQQQSVAARVVRADAPAAATDYLQEDLL